MAFAANPEQLQVNAPGANNGGLVFGAMSRQIRSEAVWKMNVIRRKVNLAEKVLAHELPVRTGMIRCQAHVLVEIEGHDPGEIQSILLMHPRQCGIDTDGCGTCRQPQHTLRLALNLASQDLRGSLLGFGRGGFDDDFHAESARPVCARRSAIATEKNRAPPTVIGRSGFAQSYRSATPALSHGVASESSHGAW